VLRCYINHTLPRAKSHCIQCSKNDYIWGFLCLIRWHCMIKYFPCWAINSDALIMPLKTRAEFSVTYICIQAHEWCSDLRIWLELVQWEVVNGIQPILNPRTSSTTSFQCLTLKLTCQMTFPSFFKCEGEEPSWLPRATDVATVPSQSSGRLSNMPQN